MGFFILAAFIAVPIIEIGLFIQVGGAIGLGPTLLIVVATAIAGTLLLRQQGLSALTRLQHSLERGEAPLEPIFDGFCLLAAGILLLTPGFFTDTLGFVLFFPPLRRFLRHLIARRMSVHGHLHRAGFRPTPGGADRPGGAGDIIEGEWQEVGEPHAAPPTSPALDQKPPAKDKHQGHDQTD